MEKIYRVGAKGALLDEYQKAIDELKLVVSDISDQELAEIVDTSTTDPNCRSVATILTHVVRAGYTYAIYIRNLRGDSLSLREKILRHSVDDYKNDLDVMFEYTVQTFENISQSELEEFDTAKKMMSDWKQTYDIEQMMEHAIVHILRHRRQIEKFKIKLRNNPD